MFTISPTFRTVLIVLVVVNVVPCRGFAKDVWVAVGNGGQKLISSDGQSWMNVSDGFEDSPDLTDVVFSRDRFVAVGGTMTDNRTFGHILSSKNGMEWKQVHLGSGRIGPIVFGKDRFVVGAPNGQLLWSIDSEQWFEGAKIQNAIATHFQFASYGNSRFVFIGNRGSSNAPYWCAVTSKGKLIRSFAKLPVINGLAFGNGVFAIVGENGVRMSSADGSRWQRSDSPDQRSLEWVRWAGDKFLAGGETVFSSKDGIRWHETVYKVPGKLLWSDGTRFISSQPPTLPNSKAELFFSTDLLKWKAANLGLPNRINSLTLAAINEKSPRP